jgi:hypothetical protein
MEKNVYNLNSKKAADKRGIERLEENLYLGW